ncbi:hypothetical protein CDL15_Pgr008531 [Punica granatum]|uniref:FAF domain-containing protein n=1 Tax=Punica granatum TaxID=22663 RepID=A0A218WP23_PUNGR|nr:hypothetical protein CDL15_Pgr008531 [Punica granatum]
MATVVCQGLHSSLVDLPQKADPPLPLPPSMTLRLKLAPAKPADLGGWSFLQYSLDSGTDNSPRQDQSAAKAAVSEKDGYAPPPAREPLVKLSDRSLQLCTENLGSETGTDVSEEDNIFSNVRNSEIPIKSPTAMTRQPSGGRKVNPPREIPPPLTTMRGAETLQVQAHREEGRLIINAVKSPPRRPRFVAERTDGRLRLSLLRAEIPDTDKDSPHLCHQEVINEFQESESSVGDDQNHPPSIDTELSNGPVERVCLSNETGEVIELSSINMESFSFEKEDPREDEEIITTGKFVQRSIIRIRCNEGEHDHCRHHHQSMILLNWEPLWVATS